MDAEKAVDCSRSYSQVLVICNRFPIESCSLATAMVPDNEQLIATYLPSYLCRSINSQIFHQGFDPFEELYCLALWYISWAGSCLT